MSDDESVYKLEGYQEETGGLIIKKKPNPIESFEFKVPQARTSLLGLDKLAGNEHNCIASCYVYSYNSGDNYSIKFLFQPKKEKKEKENLKMKRIPKIVQ